MNLNELMKSDRDWLEKLDILSNLKSELEPRITNDIPLIFNIDYEFSSNLDDRTVNDQWKEVDLAIKILEFTKRWDRKYNIDLTKKESVEIFTNFFNQYIGFSTFDMVHRLKCNIYKRNKTAYLKTFVVWAIRLYDNKVINKELLNKFLEYLEDFSI